MIQFSHINVVSWLILSCYLCHVTLGQRNISTVECFDEERKALLQFKDGITEDPCGLLTSWEDDTDCCQWKGVRCNNYTGHVVLLRLQGYDSENTYLAGNLSSSLGKLKHLRHLNLNFNYLTQPDLDFLGSLTNLEYLSLSHAVSDVTDLQWLGNLSLIRYLDLSSADLSGATNWTKIVGKLSFLSVLRMDDCYLPKNISSSISNINSSSNLRVISLSGNIFNDDYSIFWWLFNLTGITTTLEHLDLSLNLIGGPIPNGFESLKVLSYLDLSLNKLEGPIPNGFERLKVLSHLDLSFNSIGGPIPNGFESLKVLSHLDLSSNHLEGPIPNGFERLKVLSHLDLSFNSIGGPIPNGFESLKVLSLLDLSSNYLEGPIPNGFGNMMHLSHLDLSYNHLNGTVPRDFQNMHSLSYLSLSHNNLQGSIFEIFTGLCNLQHLELLTNNFTDDLTNVIRALNRCENAALLFLDLGYNRFSGVIPDTIDSFSLLMGLYLDGNQLSGQIPQAIGQLGMLEVLDIRSNLIEATVNQSHFLNLPRLRELRLSNNPRLVIDIDASWDPPFQLDVISLGSCKLGPFFPNWLLKQTNLTIFDVSNTEISGTVPVSFWNSLSYNLEYLNMSHNQFSGLIPNLTTPFVSLEYLGLSSNLFEGAIPSWLEYAAILNLNDNRFSNFSHDLFCTETRRSLSMDLSNNMLTGKFPDCWTNISQLTSLHLENNRLFGNIPKSIGALNDLESLHLHNNSFSGEIPASLENCTKLEFLNLGYNSFTGNIPPWIGNLKELGVLILRRNNLEGEIPSSLCRLPRLQILDLAINHVSGEIPRCISNVTSMSGSPLGLYSPNYNTIDGHQVFKPDSKTAIVEWKRKEQTFKDSLVLVITIDFSFNELDGKIPDGIFNLTGLVSLDLSNNNLSGGIASEVGQLTALQLLDFSDNHLTGEIPASIAKLNFLGILGLSNNNLSGKIPIGTQLQSFSAASYLGNSGLCGDPLPKCSRDQAPGHAMNGNNTSVEDKHEDYAMFPGLYIAVVLGFIVGFWGVCGSLVIKTSWRHAWFRFLNNIRDRLYVISMRITAKLRR